MDKISVSRRSHCPIASTLDLLGDKWTLLIIRDMLLFDKHRNKDFQDAGEGIPTNILAARLKWLVQHGLLEKRPYQHNPPRYEYHPTQAARDLEPVLRAMGGWASRHLEGVSIPEFKQT